MGNYIEYLINKYISKENNHILNKIKREWKGGIEN